MWTLDEETRRRYVQGMTRLSVWYVWRLVQRGEVEEGSIAQALCERVNLYRLTDFWDGRGNGENGLSDAAWMECVAQMAGWVRAGSAADTERLEGRVLALLSPALERRVPKDVGPAPVRPFECWTYELGWAGLASRPGLLGRLGNPAHVVAKVRRGLGLQAAPSRDAVLHIMNVLAPQSPFDDLPRLAGTLRALIAEMRERQPQVRELWCNTWLNDHPKFRELLPAVWFASGKMAPPGNFRNWWGQFARRDGGFHESAGRRFRESGGAFPFRAMLCHAPLDAMEEHLRQRFG